jgi:hypothetical protein
MEGSGLTMIATVCELLVPERAAVSVTLSCEVIPEGAVYVLLVPVLLETLPQVAAEQEAPASDQSTGPPLATFAVT